ncbi:hypothetical protein MMC16_006667 [Acarospora aff. strigata]|nr:hypothetical protein [Acarospora aff. strigata]
MSGVEDIPALPKAEHSREASSSSIASTPEPDAETFAQENAQVQKRKGGRKPIYATSEERKQRNRQAQAAFRERRTEYIKQLETTIKHHEDTLQTLQQSHRNAADECLMLRYKNSLLERILLEKGIDVQAELRTKTGSPYLGPTNPPPPAPASSNQPSPIQRALMNRHHQTRRSASGITPKFDPAHPGVIPAQSPQLQPTPPSQTSSPSTTKSPGFVAQGGMTPPASDLQAQQQLQPQVQHQHQQPLPHPPPKAQSRARIQPHPGIRIPSADTIGAQLAPQTARSAGNGSAGTSTFYPSPFQNHIDQLGKLTQQEYDAQADMLDDQDPSDHSAGPGPYPQPFHQQALPPMTQPPPGLQGQPPMQPIPLSEHGPGFVPQNQIFDPFDPMLDADPFGLSASMHFPTQFSFQESSMRQ